MISWNIIALVLISTRGIVGLQELLNSTEPDENLEIFSGFRLTLHDQELRIKLDPKKMFPVNAVQGKTHNQDEEDKTPGNMVQKFGSVIAMLPLIMQMLSLPGAIASIKMSLLKSIFVAKLAMFVMLYNVLKNLQPSEVVVVHQTPAQHHDHFYPQFHEEYEDSDKGWFG